MNELLGALEKIENVHIVFTIPNADAGGRILFKMIEKFESRMRIVFIGAIKFSEQALNKLVEIKSSNVGICTLEY